MSLRAIERAQGGAKWQIAAPSRTFLDQVATLQHFQPLLFVASRPPQEYSRSPPELRRADGFGGQGPGATAGAAGVCSQMGDPPAAAATRVCYGPRRLSPLCGQHTPLCSVSHYHAGRLVKSRMYQ